MTTIDDARAWFHRVNACFQAYQEAEQRLAECEVKVEEAEIMGSKRLAERWRTDLEYAQAQLTAVHKHLLILTRTEDRAAAVNRLVDMAVRLEDLNEKHEQWRRTLAAQQFVQLMEAERGPEQEAREEAERMVELALDLYERSQRILVAAVPIHA